jgi:integrase/recombinase XerD
MKYNWKKIGIGSVDTLGIQFQKTVRLNNQRKYSTRRRYLSAQVRFIKFVGGEFKLQKLVNLQDKHLFAYVDYLKSRDCTDSYIKTELSAIQFMHNNLDGVKHTLLSPAVFNLIIL